MATTSFIYRVESDKALLAAVGRMYAEALVDHSDPRASGWREQVRFLISIYDRAVVIESLMESVPGLNQRHAVTMVDLAERSPSDLVQAVDH